MNMQSERMLNLIIVLTRVGVVAFWIAFALARAGVITAPVGPIIVWVGVFVLLAHLAEYLLIRFGIIVLRQPNASFLMTMIFGFSYWLPLMERKQA